MSKVKAHPFAGLLGTKPAGKPRYVQSRVVVEGQVVTDVRQIDSAVRSDGDDDELVRARKLKAEAIRAKNAARYQRDRQDPEKMAKRQAWRDANPDKVAEYKRRNRERHADRNRESSREHARRSYAADPEKHRARTRAYYYRHRDRILAALKARKAADAGDQS